MPAPDTKFIITGGTVIDGTGGEPVAADVVVEDGRIREIGMIEAEDMPRLDASGMYVTPGFIDIHSHSDFTLLVDPRAVSQISQGVTLEVVGNCGHGCAPIGDPDEAKGNIYGSLADFDIGWRTMAGYLERLDTARPAVNVATLVANGNLRMAAVAELDRPATAAELGKMKALLQEGLEAGAIGYSTGLDYGAELACPEDEIIELCRTTAAAGGYYATHTRNEIGKADEAIAEAIRAAAAAEVPLQVSHISVVARLSTDSRGAIEHALAQVEEARDRGLDVEFDMHTRLFGTTNLSTMLPAWAMYGTVADIAKRLEDTDIRRQFREYPNILTTLADNDWSRIVLVRSKALPEYSQMSIADIATQRGTDVFDAIYDILLADIGDLHGPMIVAHAYNEDDIRPAFLHDRCMVGSDATALATDGPLACQCFHGAFTWAAWFFRHFVRDTALLTAPEAIRRMTSLPATRLGLSDRGVLRPGACADIAIFDPQNFAERGTTFEPNQVATGMTHVIVNGIVALEDGQLTGNRGGRVLRS